MTYVCLNELVCDSALFLLANYISHLQLKKVGQASLSIGRSTHGNMIVQETKEKRILKPYPNSTIQSCMCMSPYLAYATCTQTHTPLVIVIILHSIHSANSCLHLEV